MDDSAIKVFIDEKTLQAKVKELGELITEDYQGRIPILIAVLKGSFIFVADICRHIKVPVVFD